MLDIFRQKGLSNVIYGVIMAATIFAFVITFRPNAQSRTASLSEACVARVYGRCIDPKDFGAAYRMLMPTRSTAVSRKMNLKRVALDGLVERELLAEEAKRLGIGATDSEVTDQLYSGFVRVSVPAADPAIARAVFQEMYQGYARSGLVQQEVALANLDDRDSAIPVDFRDPKTKRFDIKTYERVVRNLSNRSTTEFREEQARELVASKMRDVIRGPVRVSEDEAWQAYAKRYTTAQVGWIAGQGIVGGAVGRRPGLDGRRRRVGEGPPEEVDALAEQLAKDDVPVAGHIRHILVKVPYGASDAEKAAALAKLSWAARARPRRRAFRGGRARDVRGHERRLGRRRGRQDRQVRGALPHRGRRAQARRDDGRGRRDPVRLPPDHEGRPGQSGRRRRRGQARRPAHRVRKGQGDRRGQARRHPHRRDDARRQERRRCDHPDRRRLRRYRRREGEARQGRHAQGPGAAPPRRPTRAPTRAGAGDTAAATGPLPAATFDATTDPDRPQAQTSSEFNRGGDPFPGLSPDGTGEILAFVFSGAHESADGGPRSAQVMPEPVRITDAFAVVELKQYKQPRRDRTSRRTARRSRRTA